MVISFHFTDSESLACVCVCVCVGIGMVVRLEIRMGDRWRRKTKGRNNLIHLLCIP